MHLIGYMQVFRDFYEYFCLFTYNFVTDCRFELADLAHLDVKH